MRALLHAGALAAPAARVLLIQQITMTRDAMKPRADRNACVATRIAAADADRRADLGRDERGFVLVATAIAFLLLLTLAGAGMVYSTIDLKSTSHYDTGNQAFAAAESGVLHALSSMNNAGVIDFQGDVVQRWSTVYGTGEKSMPGYSSISYQVAVEADAGDPSQGGTIISTGLAPLGARRTVRVGVRRGGFTGARGAIYLAADAVTSQFNGNAFDVDGNDYNVNGTPNAGGPVMPGIATRNDTVSGGVINSLNTQQKDNVKGMGFSLDPLTPSVIPSGGPSVDDLDQIAANFLSRAGVVTSNSRNLGGNQTLGTVANPQITHLTNSSVTIAGNLTGAGVIIADGSIRITGTIEFIGWIIVRGETTIDVVSNDQTILLGNATIYGSLWTGDLRITVGGSAMVGYCQACIQLVDGMDNVGTTPRPMTVTSWSEVL
jgi:hypothetical protein